MQTILEQVLSFFISWALGAIWVIIRYTNKVRNDEIVKLKWFLSELVTGMLLAGSSYTLLPDGWLKVPLAIFIWYFSHTILDLAEKKVPNIIESKMDNLSNWKKKDEHS